MSKVSNRNVSLSSVARWRPPDVDASAEAELVRFLTDSFYKAGERVAGLTSVVFGLSFLALQIEDPQRPGFLTVAWISLGGTLITSVISIVSWHVASSFIFGNDIAASYRNTVNESAAVGTELRQPDARCIRWLVNIMGYFAAFSVIPMLVGSVAGIVLLVMFTYANISR